MTAFQTALTLIDDAHREDPTTLTVAGEARAAELVYAERMSAMLAAFAPDAGEALRLAARAQHLRRWMVPRDRYPMDRAGYHRWRNDLKRQHAASATDLLAASGVDAVTIARTAALIRKDNLKSDPDAQTLEDVACLVFLQHYADAFAAKHRDDPVKMSGILQKTWAKMSDTGRAAALQLPLSAPVRELVAEALAGGGTVGP